MKIVGKYEHIEEFAPEIIRELVEKIVIHAPDKSSGHGQQQIDIYYRFNIAISTAIAGRRNYDKKGEPAQQYATLLKKKKKKKYFFTAL